MTELITWIDGLGRILAILWLMAVALHFRQRK